MIPRFKGIVRESKVEKTTAHRFTFGYDELIRLLRLPPGTALTVEHYKHEGVGEVRQTLDMAGGSVALIATVTVKS